MGISFTTGKSCIDSHIKILVKKQLRVVNHDYSGPIITIDHYYMGDFIRNIKIGTILMPFGLENEYKWSFDNAGSDCRCLIILLDGEKYKIGNDIMLFKDNKVSFVSDCIEIIS